MMMLRRPTDGRRSLTHARRRCVCFLSFFECERLEEKKCYISWTSPSLELVLLELGKGTTDFLLYDDNGIIAVYLKAFQV